MTFKKILSLSFFLIINLKFTFNQEFNKSIIKTFFSDSINSLEIINKYGDIIINKWTKDSIRIKATLSIKSNNESRINKIKNDISFIIETKKDNLLSAKTNIGSSANLLENLFNTQKKFKLDYDIKIDYYIYMPIIDKLNYVYLETKYGDIFIDNIKSKTTIKISYGSLICKNIESESDIYLFSTNACIDRINNSQINSLYSEIEIKKSNNLEIESRVSKYIIENSNNLKIKSNNDNFILNNINSLNGSFYFTDITLNKLIKDLNCILDYSKISINQIHKNTSFIYLDSEFSDIELYLSKTLQGAYIDIKYSKVSTINYPEDFCKFEDKLLNSENEVYLLYGKCGNNPETKININLINKNNLNLLIK